MAEFRRPTPSGDRRPSVVEYAVSRLRRSFVLRGCAALAFLEYGALVIVAVFGEKMPKGVLKDGSSFPLAGWMALCSLGSWFFLFAWYPFLRTLHAEAPAEGGTLTLGRVLESIAISCVAVVHVMLAVVLATVI